MSEIVGDETPCIMFEQERHLIKSINIKKIMVHGANVDVTEFLLNNASNQECILLIFPNHSINNKCVAHTTTCAEILKSTHSMCRYNVQAINNLACVEFFINITLQYAKLYNIRMLNHCNVPNINIGDTTHSNLKALMIIIATYMILNNYTYDVSLEDQSTFGTDDIPSIIFLVE